MAQTALPPSTDPCSVNASSSSGVVAVLILRSLPLVATATRTALTPLADPGAVHARCR